jgi:predicted nuclease with TOPRIM domain
MAKEKSNFEEVESILQDIGTKIEHLIEKGAEVTGEAKVEIENKINALRENKTTLEEEFKKAKEKVEQAYQEKREEIEPNLQESRKYFLNALEQIKLAFKALIGKQ